MENLTLETELTKLQKSLEKLGRQDFVELVDNAAPQELDSKILSLAKHREEIQSTKQNDPQLKEISDQKRELAAPYQEQLKANKVMARYAALVLKQKVGNE